MTAQDSLRARLRTGTQSLHRALDGAMSEDASVRTRAGYLTFLQCMDHAHARFGDSLDDASLKIGLPPSSASLRRAIEVDIASLGGGAMETADPSSPDDPPHPMGVAYALEGSSMGASFLVKELAKSYPIDALPSHAYLNEAAKGARTRWPAVCAALEDPELIESEDSERICTSAQAVFHSLLDFMAIVKGGVDDAS